MKIPGPGRGLCFAASWLLLGLSARPVTAQLLGPEFQVNSSTTGTQIYPAVAANGSGNFVVVWESGGDQDGSGYGVFAQRFDSAGSFVGSQFQVNTYTTGAQAFPAVAASGSGNFVVVWQSELQDGSADGVFGQRFDSAGGRLGSEFQVNAFTSSGQAGPAVAADGSGSFVVAWSSNSQDGFGYGVFAQRYDSAGALVGSEFQVNGVAVGTQDAPAVSELGAGNFIVVWQGNGEDGSSYGVFAQRYNSAGGHVGDEFQVNTYTTGSQVYPAVAADSSGNFVVVWQSDDQDLSYGGIFGQRFDSAGSTVGSEFQVNAYTTDRQRIPAVAADGSGGFAVAWTSSYQDGSNYGVFWQRFDSSGSKAGSELQVNSYTTSGQNTARMAADGSGNFVVVWKSYDQDGDSYGVFGQRLTISIFGDDFEQGDVCAWSAQVGSGDVCLP